VSRNTATKKRRSRAGERPVPWTAQHDRQVSAFYKQGKPVSFIARQLKRTPSAVQQRVAKKLGLTRKRIS
jgi:hypothetical protein